MAKNFYNLPSAWNPRYAIPDSVLDENLERRAFVTAQTPRGTYDDPSVGNGGYDVPRYIDDEGYGQGTLTTAWLPRGYYGPKIPHYLDQAFSTIVSAQPASGNATVLKMETLGDDARPYAATVTPIDDRFQQFGRRSAAALMTTMDRLPEGQRPMRMRQAMDAMDPKLYGRTVVYADRLRRRGYPPRAALAHGLAAGITEGMLSELSRAGASRSAPQAHSLPGLGCYGCDAALGATPSVVGKLVKTFSTVQSTPSTNGACPAGQTGYNWIEATSSAPAHWERVRAGNPAQFCGSTPPAGPPGGVTVTNTETGEKVDTTIKVAPTLSAMAQIGPWVFSMDGGVIRTHMSSIPAAWSSFVADQIKLGADKAYQMSVMAQGGPFKRAGVQPKFATIDGALIGKPGQSVKVFKNQIDGSFPLVKVLHPVKKKWWALYLQDLGQNGDGSFVLRFAEIETNWLSDAFAWIRTVVAKIIDVVKDAVSAIAGLACQLVSQPGATAAAAAASGGTAAVGTAIAAGMCQTPTQTPIPPPPPSSSSDLVVPLALGAGAIGIALLLKKKKR